MTTPDIDIQVAAFAAQLEGLDGLTVDVHRAHADVNSLGVEIVRASSHELAAVALREFLDAHPTDPDYARSVVVGTLAQLGLYVMLAAPMESLPGDDGLLRRVQRVAYAARGLGIDAWAGGR